MFADEETDRQNRITFAYLLHFAHFTEWAVKPKVFNFCVYDDFAFSELLKEAYVGKKIENTPVNVENITIKSNVDSCQLVYFPNQASAELLLHLNKKPILSIGSQKNILEQGIIYLFSDNQKLHFFINTEMAHASGLKISSQLLMLSKDPSS
ncbi:MAG: YfiR family protein [Methylococcales bacterium]|nr:YfiR family protein [Methylococcales bacterium]